MRILIAEDDRRLLKSLVHIFEMNHYAVDGVDNGNDAFDFASSNEYDGLVLDIMMPGMDGVSLLGKLRAKGITTPALFLTARTEIDQRIEGLDAGADDYLPKPFSTGELLARVRAMLRRKDNFTPDMLNFGALSLNRSTYSLCVMEKRSRSVAKNFK
jgi:DNA-binding response OmpR family regulator